VRGALVIAGKDLRQRLRDRSALVIGFVAPVGIAAIMSGAFSSTDDLHFEVGLVAPAGDELAGALAEVLASDELGDLLSVETYPTRAEAAAAVDDGDVQTAIVVPTGFAERVATGDPGELVVLSTADQTIAAQVAGGVADAFLAQVDANRLSVTAALAAGAPAERLGELVEATSALRLPVQVVEQPTGTRPMNGIDYYGPGMAIFFALFTVGFTARSFFVERRQGTVDRIAAAPIAAGSIVLGKALTALVTAGASLASMWLVTTVVFGANWGEPLAAGLLAGSMVLAIVALTALVIVVARTERQAEGMASLTVFGLALIGGNFVFQSEAPPLLRSLALLTPNGWALRGFTDLATGSDDLDAVVAPVLAIGAFAAVVGVIALVLSRRAVLR
jgi:ABC-2 type transport system permease protein